jgi:S-adenosylmethionine/arginine decarboxylase-like enzyme
MTPITSLRSHHFAASLPTAAGHAAATAGDWLAVLEECVREVGLRQVGAAVHDFEPAGSSAVLLLAESHVAVHHWPELARLTVDIHVCDFGGDNERRARQLAKSLSLRVCGVEAEWEHLVVQD